MASELKSQFLECIIYTNSKEGSAKGNVAVGELRYGKQGAESAILLLLSKNQSGVAWRSSMLTLQQNGHASPIGVVRGVLLEEAIELATKAVAKIKETFGKTDYGKTYRIAKNVCEIIDNPK